MSLNRSPPALTPEGRESELTALAMQLAEQQLRDGTASSQTINFFLQRSTPEHLLALEQKRLDLALTEAKTQALKSEADKSELFAAAIDAMRAYGGGLQHE